MKTLKDSIAAMAVKTGMYKWIRLLNRHTFRAKDFRDSLRFSSQYVSKGDLVFDVGANRGQSAEMFLALGADVVAFEPQHHLHPHINQRCAWLGRLTVDGDAVGSKNGRSTMYLREYDQASTLRQTWQGEVKETLDVSIATLDEKIAIYGIPDFCKIDVEGWESEVVSGLTAKIKQISIEYHSEKGEVNQNTIKALTHIRSLGRYECNLSKSDSYQMALDRYISMDRFLEKFPSYMEDPKVCGSYGDIYLRLSEA